jgi:hypothetical protein
MSWLLSVLSRNLAGVSGDFQILEPIQTASDENTATLGVAGKVLKF